MGRYFHRNRFLLGRRLVQLSVFVVFLLGPLYGVWWAKGNLAASTWFDTIPLHDPFIALQSLAAGHGLACDAVLGAVLIATFYFIVGGRAYCAWICPINVVTDAAMWLRNRLGVLPSWGLPRSSRVWLAISVFVVSAATGTIAWELVNPITMLHRGVVFGLSAVWIVVLAVFLLDLLVLRRGWCGHICPVGAFYGVIGKGARLRVEARRRTACSDCGDCFRVCPEPHVIGPALKPNNASATPLITNSDCTNCGRCLDICPDDVFVFRLRSLNQYADR